MDKERQNFLYNTLYRAERKAPCLQTLTQNSSILYFNTRQCYWHRIDGNKDLTDHFYPIRGYFSGSTPMVWTKLQKIVDKIKHRSSRPVCGSQTDPVVYCLQWA